MVGRASYTFLLCTAVLLLFATCIQPSRAVGKYDPLRKKAIRDRVVGLFRHGYDSYMTNAFPMDELKPLSCQGTDHFGGYTLTLIDALDMLALIGDDYEFMKQAHYIARHVEFKRGNRVSVFETTIRIVGGLVSGHQVALRVMQRLNHTGKLTHDHQFPFHYDGELLVRAVEMADLLVPAFNTPTGIPFNEIELGKGPDAGKGHTTCPAAAGSLLLEFGALSAMTGNCTYVTLARRALEGIWKHRAKNNLVGTMIDVLSGRWINVESNIGASIDSFYEYIFKAYVLFDDERYLEMWNTAYKAIQKYTYNSGWYLSSSVEAWGPLQHQDHKFNSLQAFWPGLQVLAGDVHNAMDSFQKMHCVVKELSFMPEYVHIDSFLKKASHTKRQGPGYPLRPEFLESTYYLYHATGEEKFLEIAEDFLDNLERTKQPCGFAAVVDIYSFAFEDKMDSFVLAETFKYLYMIFSPNKEDMHLMNTDPDYQAMNWGTFHRSHMLYDLQEDFLVNTEAHPLEIDSQQRQVYQQCLASAKEVHMDQNQAHRIGDDYLVYEPQAYEQHTKQSCTWHEKAKQCRKVDYMLDVAPVIAHLEDTNRCYDTVEFSVLGKKQDGNANQGSMTGYNQQQAGEAQQVHQHQMPLYLEPDPLLPNSKPVNLVLTYHSSEKKSTETFRSILMVPGLSNPNVLFMEAHAAGIFVWERNTTLFTGRAQFGPNLCQSDIRDDAQKNEGGQQQQQQHRTFHNLGREMMTMPIVHLNGNGCQDSREQVNPDGTTSRNPNTIDHAVHPEGTSFGILIKRGGCMFKEKVLTAQSLGAKFVVIYNHEPEGGVSVMADAELPFPGTAEIPSFMITIWDARSLASEPLPDNQPLEHTTKLSVVTVTCATDAEEQFRAMGVGLIGSQVPEAPPHLIMYRLRVQPIVKVLNVRNKVNAIKLASEMKQEQPLPSFPLEKAAQVLAPFVSPAGRLIVVVDPTNYAAPSIIDAEGRLWGRFFSEDKGEQLIFVHDADPNGAPPHAEAEEQAQFLVNTNPRALLGSQMLTVMIDTTAGTRRGAPLRPGPSAAAATESPSTTSASRPAYVAEYTEFFLSGYAQLIDMFLDFQVQFCEEIEREGPSLGIVLYYFSVDQSNGKVFEVFVYASEEKRSALRRGDYENSHNILNFHILEDIRSQFIDAAEETKRTSVFPVVGDFQDMRKTETEAQVKRNSEDEL